MNKLEAAALIRSMMETGKNISIHGSSNEIAGKLAKHDYSSIEWHAGKPGWHLYSIDNWSGYRDESEVWKVLSTGEDWKHEACDRSDSLHTVEEKDKS